MFVPKPPRGGWNESNILNGEKWNYVLYRDPCVYCGGQATTADHIVALSRGGQNGWWNRAPACLQCNNRKGSKGLLEYLIARHNGRYWQPKRGRANPRPLTHRMLVAPSYDRQGGEGLAPL